MEHVLVNSSKVPSEGSPGRLNSPLSDCLADPSLEHGKCFLCTGENGCKIHFLKNSIVHVSLKPEKHFPRKGEGNRLKGSSEG